MHFHDLPSVWKLHKQRCLPHLNPVAKVQSNSNLLDLTLRGFEESNLMPRSLRSGSTLCTNGYLTVT
ncbi:hypothetical protein PM082_003528 [Marasmius tenuissimus]|nr:hypothetical protein PM082_003528 [Marasmius tenuissimus]